MSNSAHDLPITHTVALVASLVGELRVRCHIGLVLLVLVLHGYPWSV
ncbi:hypothetical protein [Pseudonocardia sp. UM4_GMWB1]